MHGSGSRSETDQNTKEVSGKPQSVGLCMSFMDMVP
jgi:hypothetical protein